MQLFDVQLFDEQTGLHAFGLRVDRLTSNCLTNELECNIPEVERIVNSPLKTVPYYLYKYLFILFFGVFSNSSSWISIAAILQYTGRLAFTCTLFSSIRLCRSSRESPIA